MTIALDLQLLSELFTDGWNDEDGAAAKYKSSGSDYRTYRPEVSPTPEGGLFASTKIDHIRGYQPDDHNQLEMEFDRQGEILSARSVMNFAGIPQFDTDLIRAAGGQAGEDVGKIAELSAKILNSLERFITEYGETGG